MQAVSSHFRPVAPWLLRDGVPNSPELDRIVALPRRKAISHVEELTDRCALQGADVRLREIQARALAEAEAVRGLLGIIGVGEGKTLISLLLPLVLGAKRPLLLVPPKLKDQLLRHAAELSKQWRIVPFEVATYSDLSNPRKATLLEDLSPDLVVADECHHLKRVQSVRTGRVRNYAKQHPECAWCFLSGSITSKSIKDYAHLSRLALRRNSPVPLLWKVLEDWSLALDPDPFIDPGALSKLCLPGEEVRSGYRRRLVDTEGVVASSDKALGTALNFYERKVKPPPAITKALTNLRQTWSTPGGEEFSTALDFTRHALELAQGFYYKWTEPPPVEWKTARTEWARELRGLLRGARPGTDSPLLVENAIKAGRIVSYSYAAWAAIRDSFKPVTTAVWLDRFLIDDAIKWADEHKGIVWYEDVAVGAALAEAGLEVYGAGTDAELASGKSSIACSVMSQAEGRNLQWKFFKNLVLCPSTNGAKWEQLLGRTHRQGQPEDEVEVYIYRHTPELKEALPRALEDARYFHETKGGAQKLLQATFVFSV